MKTSINPGSGTEFPTAVEGHRVPYTKPQLSSFGTLASVTGSGMGGSFLDTMTNMINDSTKGPMM